MSTKKRFLTAALGAALALPLLALAQPSQALDAAGIAASRSILPSKALRTPAEGKLDSRLLFAHRAAMASSTSGASAPTPPGFVQSFMADHVASDGTVFVVIRGDVTPELLTALESLGAREVEPFTEFATIHARVPVNALVALAAQDGVRSVAPRALRRTQRYIPGPEDPPQPFANMPKVGSVNWQGVAAHQASVAHQAGFTGAGTKLCVLSDGVDTLSSRIASGNLPSATTVLAGQAGAGDEGTAMLELAYDMAPGVTLAFATAGNSPAQFASNILALQSTLGCNVIVDDVLFLEEPAFQDGEVAQAVNTVAGNGVLYFSAAGNDGSLAKNNSATWQGDFTPSSLAAPAAIAAVEGNAFLMQSFSGVPYLTLARSTDVVSIQWSEPLGGAKSDYDVFVMDSTGANILCSPGINLQNGSQDAVDSAFCNSGVFPAGSRVYVVVGGTSVPGNARGLRIHAFGGKLSTATNGATFGHMATTGAIGVGAVDVRSAGGGSFVGGSANPVTSYSSDGPRRFFFTPTGADVTQNNRSFGSNGGISVAKVDLAASDCGSTTTPGFTPFCGTSAAAPSAAALAALVRSASPSATAAQVKAALVKSALDIEGVGADVNSGAGIPMAPAAVRAMLSPLTTTKTFTPSLIAAGGTSELRIQLDNPNGVAMQGVGFNDIYLAPMANAAAASATMSGAGCTGSLTGVGNGTQLMLAGGIIPAHGSCVYRITVTSPSTGSFVDSSGALATAIGLATAGASARLDVARVPAPPTNVSVSPGSGMLTVHYTAPSDTGGLPLTGFAATCTPVTAGSAVTVAAASLQQTSIIVSPLVNGTPYVCTVAAFNVLGGSVASAGTAPAPPARTDQTIAFDSVPPAIAYAGGPAYVVAAHGSLGGTPVFTVDAASAGSCSINASTVTFTAAGTCTVQADIPGNAFINDAPRVSQAIAVTVATSLVLDAPAFDFGPTSMGTRSPLHPVVVANYTGTTLTVGAISVPPGYVQVSDCGALAPGASCVVGVTFMPTVAPVALNGAVDVPGLVTVAVSDGTTLSASLTGHAEKSLVPHLYRAILNRAADEGGKNYWEGESARMAGLGADVNESWFVMAGYFFNSAEYRAGNKDDGAFVSDLYNTFFDRPADSAGSAYWVGQIQQGLPRDVVMFSFMFSPEFVAFTQGIFGTTAARPEVNVVMDFFRGVLNRLPDTASFQYWLGRLRTAQCSGAAAVPPEVDAISTAFVFSTEYTQRSRTNAQFVSDMYYAFLRRGGDLGGVNFWIDQLQGGHMSRNTVRTHFLSSAEFAPRAAAVAAAGCVP